MTRRLLSILDLHGAELHALLVRLTLRADVAGELFQELFLKLADSKGLARAQEPWAYVRRAAINLAFDWRRRQARGRADAAEVEAIDPSPPVWMRLEQREQVQEILALAGELPDLTREAFVLRYVHDQGYDDVGRALGRTSHQARGLCHAAVHEIRRRLSRNPSAGAQPVRLEVFHE